MGRRTVVTQSVMSDRRCSWVASPGRGDTRRAADEALVALYTAHYRSLVRIAALLLHDTAAAEDVVQDAFVAMHASWRRLRDPEKALAYLRQAVVNRARSRLRHLKVVERKPPPATPESAEIHGAYVARAEHGARRALERE